MAKKQDNTWKNWENYRKGKSRLETAILTHPDEESGNKSVYNYMKDQVPKYRKYSHIMPFGNYEQMGKSRKHRIDVVSEDMLAPMDSPTAPPITNPEAPGLFNQTPQSLAGDMDIMSLQGGYSTKKSKKNKDDKKKDKAKFNKILNFGEFMKNKGSN